jgi:hypothetical protein
LGRLIWSVASIPQFPYPSSIGIYAASVKGSAASSLEKFGVLFTEMKQVLPV